MARIFKNGLPNFPADGTELKRRLKEIEKLINNDDHVSYVNIKFVESAFQLMQDCNLITQDNINFLRSWQACRQFDERFKFLRNPSEGALRLTNDDNDVFDFKGFPRFYSGNQRYVTLNNQRLLISNDWYNDASVCPNKRQFFKWLTAHATATCKAHWDNTTFDDVPNLFPSGDAIDDNVVSPEQSLDDLHEKIDELNEKVEKLYDLWK